MKFFNTEHLVDGAAEELINVVAASFETGHFSLKSYEDFKREYPNYGKDEWEFYSNLTYMGPVGFYEEFKDDYDFDPMFVQEYSPYEESAEDDEDNEDDLDEGYYDFGNEELRIYKCFDEDEEEE